jgi:hypothetical protein
LFVLVDRLIDGVSVDSSRVTIVLVRVVSRVVCWWLVVLSGRCAKKAVRLNPTQAIRVTVQNPHST